MYGLVFLDVVLDVGTQHVHTSTRPCVLSHTRCVPTSTRSCVLSQEKWWGTIYGLVFLDVVLASPDAGLKDLPGSGWQ